MNSRIHKLLLLGNVLLGLLTLSARAATATAPVITTQPADKTVAVGGSASMSVSVSGGSPYTYQWFFGDAPIAGAIGSSLSFSGAQAGQAGGYRVVVANALGSVTSRVASLTVYQKPVITQQPLAQTAPVNSTVTLRVVAGAIPAPTYQWKFNGTAIPGATAAELILPAVTSANAGNYVVVITNPYGSASSSTATLKVSYPPVISSQPVSLVKEAGSSASFSVSASALTPLSYQWFFNGTPIAGASTDKLAFPSAQPAHTGTYRVVVSNDAGITTSADASFMVYVKPVITQEPLSRIAPVNSAVTLRVAATAVPAPAYQWKFNNTPIPGATAPELVLPAVTSASAGNYVVVVTNPYGSDTSSTATLQVSYPPVISQQPANLVKEAGSSDKFSVSASAITSLSYQWFFNGAPLAGATNRDLSFVNLQPAQTGLYKVVINNDAGTTTSEDAFLSVYVKPVFTQQPVAATVPEHGAVTFLAAVSAIPAPAYQWRKGAQLIAGANGSSFTIPQAQVADMGDYTVIASNPYGEAASARATLTVKVPATITTQPADVLMAVGQNATFTVTAAGDPTLTYQWFRDGAAIAGATQTRLVLTNVGPAHVARYSVQVSNPYGSVTSRAAALDVYQLPVFTVLPPAAQTNAPGSTLTLTAAATAIPPVSQYRWHLNGILIPGAAGPSLTFTNMDAGEAGTFTVEALNLHGVTLSRECRVLLDLPRLPIEDKFSNRRVIFGNAGTGYGDNRLATTDGGEPAHFTTRSKRSLWLRWIPPANGVLVLDTVGSTFNTVLAAYSGTQLDRLTRVGSDDDSAGFYSSRIVLNANALTEYSFAVAGRADADQGDVLFSWNFHPTETRLPVITSQPADVSVAVGAPVTLSLTYGSNNVPVSVQWFFESQPIPDATNTSYTIPALDAATVGQYRADLACDRFVFSTRTVEVQINTEGLAHVIAQNRQDDAADSGLNGWSLLPAVALRARLTAVTGYSGTQIFATRPGKDPGEPNHCGVVGGSSYWLSYTPASEGILRLNTDGSTYDTILAVYVDDGLGNGYASLIPVGCNDNGGANGLSSRVDVNVTNAVTYYIVVDGRNGAYGTACLNYRLTANPTISTIAAQTIAEDNSTAALSFSINDVESSATNLIVTATSSNPAIVPNNAANLTLGGYGVTRTLTVRPATNQFGTVTITLTVRDGDNQTSTTSFPVTIAPVNDIPVARTGTVYRPINVSVTINVSTLLANDTDADGDLLTVSSVASLSYLGAKLSKSGSFITYTARIGYNTPDYFTYTLSDGKGGTATGRVNVYAQ